MVNFHHLADARDILVGVKARFGVLCFVESDPQQQITYKDFAQMENFRFGGFSINWANGMLLLELTDLKRKAGEVGKEDKYAALGKLLDSKSNKYYAHSNFSCLNKSGRTQGLVSVDSMLNGQTHEFLMCAECALWVSFSVIKSSESEPTGFASCAVEVEGSLRCQRDARGEIVVGIKARLVAQGFRIKRSHSDYDEVFALVYKKAWVDEFEVVDERGFWMSVMGELKFFLGLQIMQKPDGDLYQPRPLCPNYPHMVDVSSWVEKVDLNGSVKSKPLWATSTTEADYVAALAQMCGQTCIANIIMGLDIWIPTEGSSFKQCSHLSGGSGSNNTVLHLNTKMVAGINLEAHWRPWSDHSDAFHFINVEDEPLGGSFPHHSSRSTPAIPHVRSNLRVPTDVPSDGAPTGPSNRFSCKDGCVGHYSKKRNLLNKAQEQRRGYDTIQLRNINAHLCEESKTKAVAFTTGFKKRWLSKDRVNSFKMFSREEVAAPSHSQDIPDAQVEVPSQKATMEDVEVPSNIDSTAQHTASSFKKVGTRKKRLGSKGVHTSRSTIPIEEGDPEAEHKVCISMDLCGLLLLMMIHMLIYIAIVDWVELLPTGLDLRFMMDSPKVNDGSAVWKNPTHWRYSTVKLILFLVFIFRRQQHYVLLLDKFLALLLGFIANWTGFNSRGDVMIPPKMVASQELMALSKGFIIIHSFLDSISQELHHEM
ncbi:hypothetical protein Tco_0505734 [Tanacetum coccineum]